MMPHPTVPLSFVHVRKHRAPKGAFRRIATGVTTRHTAIGQIAPSAKQCIKTLDASICDEKRNGGSESTERQTVH